MIPMVPVFNGPGLLLTRLVWPRVFSPRAPRALWECRADLRDPGHWYWGGEGRGGTCLGGVGDPGIQDGPLDVGGPSQVSDSLTKPRKKNTRLYSASPVGP